MQHTHSPATKAHLPVRAPQTRAVAGPGATLAKRAAQSPATTRLRTLQRKADEAATGRLTLGPATAIVAAPARGPVVQGAFDVAYQGFGTARSKDNRAIPGVHMWHPKWTEEQSEFPNPRDNPGFDEEAYAEKGKNAKRTYNRLMRGTTRDVTVALWSVKARSQKGKNHVAYLQDRTPGYAPYTYYDNDRNNPTQDDHLKGKMNATDQARFDQWDAAR